VNDQRTWPLNHLLATYLVSVGPDSWIDLYVNRVL